MNVDLKIVATVFLIIMVCCPVLGVSQNYIDSQRSQKGEVLTGEIVEVGDTPDKWNYDLTDFNYAGISVKEISDEPDSYTEILNLDEYPYLQQAIGDVHQEPWGQQGSVTFHSFDDTALDELISTDLNIIKVNGKYYEVYFLAADPVAPLSYDFENYFEMKVTNVEKTSTNLKSNETIRILYSDSQVYKHIKQGEMVKVWIDTVSPNIVNQNLDITLYQTSEFIEGHDVEVLDTTAGNYKETSQTEAVEETETPKTNGFSAVFGLIIFLITQRRLFT